MRLAGKYWKDRKSKFWVIEVPDLDISTQGTSVEDALEMIKDAIESTVDEKGFEISVFPEGTEDERRFTISANRAEPLLRLLLQRVRIRAELSLGEASKRMGSGSKNAYRQYEVSGKNGREPSLSKLDALLSPMGKEVVITLVDRAEKKTG